MKATPGTRRMRKMAIAPMDLPVLPLLGDILPERLGVAVSMGGDQRLGKRRLSKDP